MKKLLILFLPAFFLFSCDKKELPVPAYDRGDLITAQVAMGGDYNNQIWYSLNESRIVATHLKTDWDLAFEASAAGTHIMLNGAKAMKVMKTRYTSLNEVKDTMGFGINSLADMPSGNIDSTAIGNWKVNNTVYIINRGFSVDGSKTTNWGFYKLKILSETSGQYTIEYAELNSTEIKQGTILKDPAYNFVAFSMTDNKQVYIEPKKTDYDLCFTQYTHLFYEPSFQYYQVTGTLINTYNTRVAKFISDKFNDITIADTAKYQFETRRDKIGYDWKDFVFADNKYVINPKICYFIQDSRGFYYKLHFIDFINASGIKGYPMFEFKKL